MSAHVYVALKDRLINGAFAPGSWLRVEQLKVEYGVSKQPVMDAMRLLQGDGLVAIIPQVGCQVATYTSTETEDFFNVFGAIEGSIAAAAALRHTQEQIDALVSISSAIGQLRQLTDAALRSREYLILNRSFHGAIYEMADSRIMTDLSRRMHDMADFLINTSGYPGALSNALDARHDDHEAIIRALQRGDAEAAREVASTHIAATAHITHGK